MSKPARRPSALLSAVQPPRHFDRTARIKLLGEFAKATLADRKPSKESLFFVAGAISKWLSVGGDLARDYFKVVKPKSHHTPAAIWRELQGPHLDDDEAPAPAIRLRPHHRK
jgi:hypothetical protein